MSENYCAWNISIDDFFELKHHIDRLKFLLRFGALAPSSHNSQPWRFSIEQNNIIVARESKRSLTISDKNDRQLFISLGCAAQNIITAATCYGFDASFSFLPEREAIQISFHVQAIRHDATTDKLLRAILTRHTNRNKYDATELPSDFVQHIHNFSTPDMQIHLMNDKKQKQRIADIVSTALVTAMDDTSFREELSHYLLSNITHKKIGMTGVGFGMPTPISLIAPFLIKYININRLSRKTDEKLLKEFTPMFGIISTRHDDAEHWIRAGMVFEKIALEAESQNIRTAPMAAAIQIGEYYKNLQQELHTDFRPQIFFRMGYCGKQSAHSPRLGADEVTA